MDFVKSCGVSIQRAFEKFHENNPHVYKLFEKETKHAIIDKNKKKLSAKMIINAIRWNIFLETVDDVEFTDKDGNKTVFRINDAYTSRYARLFIQKNPEYENIFNLKELR